MKKWIPIASGLMAGFVAATISFADFSQGQRLKFPLQQQKRC